MGCWRRGPVGAALGVLIGHQFDTGRSAARCSAAGPEPGAGATSCSFPATFRVMGHVAKADGHVSEQEIASARAVMHALHLNPEQMRPAIGYFTEGKQPDSTLDAALARAARRSLRAYPELAHFFIEIQLQASLAGNGLSDAAARAAAARGD